MTISSDDEAIKAIAELLEVKSAKTGPTWLKVVDLCFYVRKRLTDGSPFLTERPRFDRRSYMRNYMRLRRAAAKASKSSGLPKVTTS